MSMSIGLLIKGNFLTYLLNGSPSRELEETTKASTYHVAEHHPARPDSLQPHTERSSRPGSEPPSVEADVYVWRYALLVGHARKEEEELECGPMPNVMVTLQNTGGALCSMSQSLADAHYLTAVQ